MEKTNITVDVSCLVKEFNFSFEEIILTIKEKLNQGGAVALAEFIFFWVSKILCRYYADVILTKMKKSCCESPYWLAHGSYRKSIKTTLGKLGLQIHRMKCHSCQATFSPFNIFFGLSNNRSWSLDLEKTSLEMIKDQSFRRTVKHLYITTGVKISKNLVHKMVLNSDLKKQDLKIIEDLQVIAADATGYKPHNENSKKDLKIVLGMNKQHRLIPVGAWIRSSWSQIGKEIKKANHPNKSLAFKPVANIFLSDGEVHMINGLKHLACHQQRCQWHFVRDFKYAYIYQGEGKKEDSRIITNYLWEMMRRLSIEEKPENEDEQLKILADVLKAEKELEQLELKLAQGNHSSAATYLRNARFVLFNHLRVLLKSGEKVAKVTSQIERFMRELARRMKRIAHNWSERGAEIMARILMKLTLDPVGWENYWEEKMKITGNFELEVKMLRST